MKNLNQFILEAQLDKAIDQLASIFKSILLKDITLSESDFEKVDNNTFNLTNVQKDGKLVKEFYNKRVSLSYAPIHTITGQDYIELAIVQSGKDNIFIKLNLDGTGDNMAKFSRQGTPGNIVSVDMSKEIKNALI